MAQMNVSDKIEYWKVIRNTIQKFDDILTKISFQGLTILIGILSVAGYLITQRLLVPAGLVSLGIFLVAITLSLHTWLYFRLLEKAVATAVELERDLFPNNPNLRLSETLKQVPGKKSFPVLLIIHIVVAIIACILAIISLFVLPSYSIN